MHSVKVKELKFKNIVKVKDVNVNVKFEGIRDRNKMRAEREEERGERINNETS